MRVGGGRDEVFGFFSNADNLASLTPPWVRFEILTPAPIEMGVGTLIDYRIRVRGVPMRWRTRIEVWEPPHRFVDVQIRGPYRFWRHEHRFESVADGTMVMDRVEYRAPVAWLTHRLFVRRDVQRIFAFRESALGELFGTETAASPV